VAPCTCQMVSLLAGVAVDSNFILIKLEDCSHESKVNYSLARHGARSGERQGTFILLYGLSHD